MSLTRTSKYFVPSITVLLAFLTAMSPFATDTYLSAMPSMANYFGVKINLVELTLTLYFLGFATGNFFGGPLSDSFGRKKIALLGVILYGISAALISISSRIEYLWIFRFTQAFGGGFASVTSMVFVRDWFEGRQVAKMATIIGMIMMLAPLFAPVIGGALLLLFNWQAIFHFMMSYAILLFTIFYFLMPESRDKKLITKKITIHQFVNSFIIFFQIKKPFLFCLQ
ncbi:MAG: MFS transporter [Ignavibacteriae bacterium]|nr:MFS transporter [Ignavibacteriota bacterium]